MFILSVLISEGPLTEGDLGSTPSSHGNVLLRKSLYQYPIWDYSLSCQSHKSSESTLVDLDWHFSNNLVCPLKAI